MIKFRSLRYFLNFSLSTQDNLNEPIKKKDKLKLKIKNYILISSKRCNVLSSKPKASLKTKNNFI